MVLENIRLQLEKSSKMGVEYSKYDQLPTHDMKPPSTTTKQSDAPPPYRTLARLTEETEDRYQERIKDLEQFLRDTKNYPNFRGGTNISDEMYQYFGRIMASTTWNTVPSKDWSHLKCQLWIRTYLMVKMNNSSGYATECAESFHENGQWLIYMGMEEWIQVCPNGGRSIWRLLQDLKEEGKL